ncbi:MAG TPA: zf-HC2 domain-containing protein [Vicinamibacterales bacterium]|nr:zf-HC2 domain-containing protein [Vicinamibacterales bacterium]
MKAVSRTVNDMHPNEEVLNAYADGSLTAGEAAEVDQHLGACVSCRQLVDDVREILRATSDLDVREPPVRVWPRIERAILLDRDDEARRTSALHADDGARRAQSHRGAAIARRYGKWLAAAAVLVLATAVGVRYLPGRHADTAGSVRPPAESGAEASASGAAQAVESELRQAEAHYENAIKGLEQIANAEQNALDPRTAATLQKNLAVIDQAISESRAAVRSQPTSEPAQASLIENFKTKISLLQDTVALINEMRKGNEAGAARIVSGLKEKGN